MISDHEALPDIPFFALSVCIESDLISLALGRTRGKSPGGDGGEGFGMDYIEGADDWIAPEWLAEGTRRLSSRSMVSLFVS